MSIDENKNLKEKAEHIRDKWYADLISVIANNIFLNHKWNQDDIEKLLRLIYEIDEIRKLGSVPRDRHAEVGKVFQNALNVIGKYVSFGQEMSSDPQYGKWDRMKSNHIALQNDIIELRR